jgi:creatinine amidohydrolase
MARLEELTSYELKLLLESGVTSAVVPFGSVEAHGGHLPLGSDALLADIVGAEVATRLNAVVAPTVRVGYAAQHMTGLGTVTIADDTLQDVAFEIGHSLFIHGFRRLILVSTHGGNQPALRAAAERLNTALDDVVACAPQGDVGPDPGRHSGRWLTSVMLAVEPDLVAPERADPGLSAEVRAASAAEGAIALERFIASIVAGARSHTPPEF